MTQQDFEAKRLARKKRERLRKKRIRSAILLVCLLGIIIIACIIFASTRNQNNINDPQQPSGVISQSAAPSPDSSFEPQATSAASATIPPASEQNDLLKIAASAQTEQKICYLTFDDGPTTSVTPLILDTLRKYNIKATFFQVGSMIEANPDMARRVYDEGHLLANHSYKHEYKQLYASADSFMSEINQTNDLIKNVGDGEEPFRLIRFPGGGYNAGTWGKKKQEYKELLKQNGYYYADWNSLNGDAEGGKKTADQLLEGVKNSIKGHQNAVILMHDAAAKKTTAEALPAIIDYLISEGYTFRRMDDIPYTAGAAEASATPEASASSSAAPTSTAAANAPAKTTAKATTSPSKTSAPSATKAPASTAKGSTATKKPSATKSPTKAPATKAPSKTEPAATKTPVRTPDSND